MRIEKLNLIVKIIERNNIKLNDKRALNIALKLNKLGYHKNNDNKDRGSVCEN